MLRQTSKNVWLLDVVYSSISLNKTVSRGTVGGVSGSAGLLLSAVGAAGCGAAEGSGGVSAAAGAAGGAVSAEAGVDVDPSTFMMQ